VAKIIYSPLVAGMSGAAADAVCSNWKGRHYVRKRVVPHNPQTDAQDTVRESMGRIPPLWRSLETQIKDVLDAAAVSSRMSGYNAFCHRNRLLEETFESGDITPGNPQIDGANTLALTDATGQIITVDWTGGTQGAGYKAYILYRRIDGVYLDNHFTVGDKDTTLMSAETFALDVSVAGTYLVVLANELVATHEFSACKYDTVVVA
jgi:hypothetical protein